MPNQFETVREMLLSGGIAPRHVRRYLRELNDHLADLTKAQCAAGYEEDDALIRARAAMGKEVDLAQAILAQPGSRSFTARAPWLVFLIVPPPFAVMATLILTVVPIFFVFSAAQLFHQVDPNWFQSLIQMATRTATFLPPLLVATLLVIIAARQRIGWVWPLLGIAMIVIFSVQIQIFHGPGHLNFVKFSATLLPRRYVPWGHTLPLGWLTFLVQLALSLLPMAWLVLTQLRWAKSR